MNHWTISRAACDTKSRWPDPASTSWTDIHELLIIVPLVTYIVPVAGDCQPQQDALDLAWLSPEEALQPSVVEEMAGGHGVLLRQALAHLGHAI